MKYRFGTIIGILGLGLFLSCSGGGLPATGTDNNPADQGFSDIAGQDLPDVAMDQGQEVLPVACNPGETCDDKDPCTIDDLCGDDGFCHGRVVEGCDDKLKCTTDACTTDTDCTHDLKNGWCLVDGKCYKEGDTDKDNQCMACITAVATDKLVPDDTLSCEDGNECTKGDQCQAGKCIGGPINCDDGNVCTADKCDVANGKCVHTPVDGACNDNNVCTIGDTCKDGQCQGQGAVNCDDGNACTDDSCDPIKGCVHTPNTAPCDDGNACTKNDGCKDGQCQGDLTSCDDNNVCTDDSCVPSKGCVHIPNTAPCDDKNPCTVGDFCSKTACQPGPDPLDCNDDNLCTDDSCNPKVNVGDGDPHKACVYTANSEKCDDNDVCTLNDFCAQSQCQPGPTLLDCDDKNVCTADSCDPIKGCEYENLSGGRCDDGNICTAQDTCDTGVCIGKPVACDDGNPCTLDKCDVAHGGCYHEADMSKPECRPKVTIFFPPRGFTMLPSETQDKKKHVIVRGKVTLPAAEHDPSHSVHIAKFIANGKPVIPMPDGTFSFPMDSVQGMNMIVIDAEDSLGIKKHLVQSYYFSNKYLNTDSKHPQGSMVTDGLKLFLGPAVWKVLANVIKTYVNNMDLNAMISNPVGSKKFGWCKYTFYVTNMRFNKNGTVLILTPKEGYLDFYTRLTGISADIKADVSGLLCPGFSGSVTIDSIVISAPITISVDANGNPKAGVGTVNVSVNGLKVHGSGIGNSIIAWFANLFKSQITSALVSSMKDMIKNQIGPALGNALKALNLDQDFDVPAMLPGMQPTRIHIKTKLHRLTMHTAGSNVDMNTMITSDPDPKLGHTVKGSITRSGCCKGGTDAITLPLAHKPLEMGLHDDMINEIVFALYYGGGLKFDLTGADLGQDLSQYGIDHLVMHIDFWLPAIITGCERPGDKLTVQIGDIGIHATMNLLGQPVDMQLFASAAFDASFGITQGANGAELAINIDRVSFLDVEVARLDGALVGQEDMIRGMIKDQLLPMVINQIAGKSLGSFPIPTLDLHAMDPSIPAGTVIKIVPEVILRKNAYTVMAGHMAD